MAATVVESLPAQPPSRTRLAGYHRALIFLASFVVKTIAGALFFGSVDVINSATNSIALLGGRQVHLPYLPAINAFLWLEGAIAASFPVLLPLSLKLIPILFDSLLGVLIYDLVGRREPRWALRAGLLYALNPLTILITGFHGQWDSIALFFLLLAFGWLTYGPGDARAQFLFGAVFGISLLIKPIGLPFLLLFPERTGGRKSAYWPAIGLGAVLACAFAIFWGYGYSLIDAFILIFCYSAKGAQESGLPFSPLLARFHIEFYRLYWIVPGIAAMGYLYRKRMQTAFDAMLLFYLFCIATTGISPQYLLWPLPLLILTGRNRLGALYTAVATPFLLLFYSNPWASQFQFENTGVFAPLRGVGWLGSPAALASQRLLPLIHALGDVAIPLCALVTGVAVFRNQHERSETSKEEAWRRSALAWYAAPLALVFAAILAVNWIAPVHQLQARLAQIWQGVPAAYGLHIQWADPRIIVTRDVAVGGLLNIVLVLALLTVGWCAIAGRKGAEC